MITTASPFRQRPRHIISPVIVYSYLRKFQLRIKKAYGTCIEAPPPYGALFLSVNDCSIARKLWYIHHVRCSLWLEIDNHARKGVAAMQFLKNLR